MRRKNAIRSFLCILVVVGLNAAANAATVTLGAAYGTATRDTMIFQNNFDNGAGGAPGFFAGSNSQPSPRRGLISFDLSSIPANATITDVQLRLVIGQLAGSGGGTNPPGTFDPVIGLHKLLVSWGEEDTGRSTTESLDGTGQGDPAEEEDATWIARFHDPTAPVLWSKPGGQANVDYTASASASLVQGNDRYDESIWLSTPTLVADVQSWLNTPSMNFGWMLINTDETDRQTFRGFFSHDYNPSSLPTDLPSTADLDEVSDFWPVLTVAYDAHLPSSDFDVDGDVDGRDFLAWQRGESPNPLSLQDLEAWQTDYGMGSLRAFSSVPEPTALLLFGLGLSGIVSHRFVLNVRLLL